MVNPSMARGSSCVALLVPETHGARVGLIHQWKGKTVGSCTLDLSDAQYNEKTAKGEYPEAETPSHISYQVGP